MFASLRVEEKTEVDTLKLSLWMCLREFVDVFPDDILDLPPEREV
ncbi:hypothetical protein A2U01_0118533, partial [Trifolium medium]|nr:hypothetical protein [Trifolium medium]